MWEIPLPATSPPANIALGVHQYVPQIKNSPPQQRINENLVMEIVVKKLNEVVEDQNPSQQSTGLEGQTQNPE